MFKKSSVPDFVKSFLPFSPSFTPVTMRFGPYAKLQKLARKFTIHELDKIKRLRIPGVGEYKRRHSVKTRKRQASSHDFLSPGGANDKSYDSTMATCDDKSRFFRRCTLVKVFCMRWQSKHSVRMGTRILL
jgi:hypothetical protein